jgi:glyoxylate reductase/hydroxypyruvate reductase 2
MPPVLAYPALAGAEYPRLDELGVRQIVDSPEALLALPEDRRRGVKVLITSASRGCDERIVDALPDLAFVLSQGVGEDKLDHAALVRRGIVLRTLGESVTEDVADHAMCLMQVMCRRLLQADAFARYGDWKTARFSPGESLYGKTLGIAGLSGRIGQAIAKRARASGMRLAALDRASNRSLGALLCDGWQALAEESDILVLAVPGTRELEHVVNARVLAALGPSGRLVNVGRGSLVDTEALIAALESRAIAGAALDVLETEPDVPPRLAALETVVLTPHMAANTWQQRARGAKIAEQEALSFLGLSD